MSALEESMKRVTDSEIENLESGSQFIVRIKEDMDEIKTDLLEMKMKSEYYKILNKFNSSDISR